MGKGLLIWGCGTHSNVIVEQCQYGEYRRIDSSYKNWKKDFPPDQWNAFVAIGDCFSRKRIFLDLLNAGYHVPNIISRDSYVSPTVELGKGIYIAPMACVQTNSIIGDACIINAGSYVAHDCKVGKFSHIAPGVHMGGSVEIGDETWIGVGTAINDHITIGNRIVVGSGSTVVTPLKDDGYLYMNAGCKAIRVKKQLVETYL
jgi:sugar O-acyltransferase (sialic acid O-acetyltransferase NeuD family)